MFFDLKDLKVFNESSAIIEYESENLVNKWTYKDLIKISKDVIALISNYAGPNEIVGIFFSEVRKSSSLVLILSILNKSCGFCFINNSSNRLLQETRLIFGSENSLNRAGNFQELESIKILNQEIQLLLNLDHQVSRTFFENIAYMITTSGSTGLEKIVRVPFSSIMPNILQLQKIFQLTENDTIFSSAPRTFDVFVVDFFLACISGSSILILDDKLKYSSRTLNYLFPASKSEHPGVTFMQMTPSIFKRWDLKDIQRILEPDSSLR